MCCLCVISVFNSFRVFVSYLLLVKAVLSLDAGHKGALFRRAHLLIRQEKLDDALKDLHRLLCFEPKIIECYHARAYVHRQMGNYGEATADYEIIQHFKHGHGKIANRFGKMAQNVITPVMVFSKKLKDNDQV